MAAPATSSNLPIGRNEAKEADGAAVAGGASNKPEEEGACAWELLVVGWLVKRVDGRIEKARVGKGVP